MKIFNLVILFSVSRGATLKRSVKVCQFVRHKINLRDSTTIKFSRELVFFEPLLMYSLAEIRFCKTRNYSNLFPGFTNNISNCKYITMKFLSIQIFKFRFFSAEMYDSMETFVGKIFR